MMKIRETEKLYNPSKIRERVMRISEDPGWIKNSYAAWGEEYISNSTYAHAIYAQCGAERFFIDGLLIQSADLKNSRTDLKLGDRDCFEDFLKRADPKDFSDLLMLLGIYLLSDDPAKSVLPAKRLPGIDPIVDGILSGSKGYVLWVYQLKQLIGLFESDAGTIKDLYVKTSVFFHHDDDLKNRLSCMKIRKGLSLKDVLEQRMTLGRIHNPRMHGAFRLHQILSDAK